MTPVLLDTSFWDVVWWLIMAYFLFLVIWMFVRVFADIFGRDDINGWAKAGWCAALIILPFISVILYFCFRPRLASFGNDRRAVTQAAATEITEARKLLDSGAITQEEFELLKARALS
jgi:hypothetical protein